MKHKALDFIDFIHKKLCCICDKMFGGLTYHGGPEVHCEVCKKQVVLCCVNYPAEEDGDSVSTEKSKCLEVS